MFSHDGPLYTVETGALETEDALLLRLLFKVNLTLKIIWSYDANLKKWSNGCTKWSERVEHYLHAQNDTNLEALSALIILLGFLFTLSLITNQSLIDQRLQIITLLALGFVIHFFFAVCFFNWPLNLTQSSIILTTGHFYFNSFDWLIEKKRVNAAFECNSSDTFLESTTLTP